jgi:Tfp pilus assembly protein PilN
MQDIDFLPAAYRQLTVHRRANVWRLLVGGGFCAVLIVSFLYQQFLYARTAHRLEELKPQFDQARALADRVAARQNELKAANQQADLYTFLRHPWPRTQLLTAALGQLPGCVTLREIHIARQANSAGEAPGVRTNGKREDEVDIKKLDPAQRDLMRLSEENRSRATTFTLSGITSDTSVLQRYLVALGKEKLFVKVELTSLEANHNEQPGTWRFAARLEIRPGYGQPGGLEPGPSRAVAQRTL